MKATRDALRKVRSEREKDAAANEHLSTVRVEAGKRPKPFGALFVRGPPLGTRNPE
jgi:hypothetical protein